MHALAPAVFTVGIIAAITPMATAGEWPKNYVVAENSRSPDGHFGVLVQSKESVLNEDDASADSAIDKPHAVYIGELPAHRILGEINGANYFQGQNHADFRALWAEDSSWCVAEDDGRFGFDSIAIIEPTGDHIAQTDVGKEIEKALARAMKKRACLGSYDSGYVSPYFRLTSDRKLRVRAVSTTDPKQLNPKSSSFALFQGTFDLAAKKWIAQDARRLSADEYSDAQTALDDIEKQANDVSFEDPRGKDQWLDERMNEVFRFVRVVLPPSQFTKIKSEQIAWLKTRDAASSAEQKAKLTGERIKTLQALLW